MPEYRRNALLEFIRGQMTEVNSSALSDSDLLQKFISRHDESAFKMIVRRHGPTVMRVCQRVLSRREDVEDVFQATFLVLARKSGSLAWPDALGSWLCGVAQRLAHQTRRKHFRQEARESHATPRPPGDLLDDITGRELAVILDEELAGLPDRYREPLLLCFVDGKSGTEGAEYLHCSLRTFQRRLQHGRELLQRRLARRGFALSMAALSGLLLCKKSSAAVSATLAAKTVQAASALVLGESITSTLATTEAVSLVGAFSHGLFAGNIRTICLLTLLLGSATLGGVWLATPKGSNPLPANASVDSANSPTARSATAEPLAPPALPSRPVELTIESTLSSQRGQIRQYAFDGDPETYFASARAADADDHFTLNFDQAVSVRDVRVITGRPSGTWKLNIGTLEGATDGREFTVLAAFANGTAQASCAGKPLRALRIRPGTALGHPLAVREISIDSEPPLVSFKYPVEYVLGQIDRPEMRPWAEHAARICERAYPLINEELQSADYKPMRVIRLNLMNNNHGIASTWGGGTITGSTDYFAEHPDDVGAFIELSAVIVGQYPRGKAPRWLVDGIGDYVRFFKFEPGKLSPNDPATTRFDSDSRATAAFLAYLVEEYDPLFVRKLNQLLREGKYKERSFQDLTGRTLAELDEEWRDSLSRAPSVVTSLSAK